MVLKPFFNVTLMLMMSEMAYHMAMSRILPQDRLKLYHKKSVTYSVTH